MANLYYVHVTPAATAATADHAIWEIWNPSSTRAIALLEVSAVFRAAAPAASVGFHLRRSSAKGTAGSTVTPAAVHERSGLAAPGSAFTIELAAFTGQPTLTSGNLSPVWGFSAVIQAGMIYPIPRGIVIPPGQGLCATNLGAIVTAVAEWGFVIED